MAISQFPAPSTGGGAAGGSLPEGAVAQILNGKLTSSGYTHPEVLPAGTYRFSTDGNTVLADFGSNGTTAQIAGVVDVTLDSNESALSLELATQFSGDGVVVDSLKFPITGGNSNSNPKSADAHICPVSGNAVYAMAQYNINTTAFIYRRDDFGAVRYATATGGVNDTRYLAVAADQNGNVYLSKWEGTNYNHDLLKWNSAGQLTYLLNNDTSIPTNTGSAGMALTPDGQTIVLTGYGQQTYIYSTDGGASFNTGTLPLTPYGNSNQYGRTVKWQNGYFFMGTSTNGSFLLSQDGINWSTYAIPGANNPVLSFATDGTTMLFACNNTNVIYKSTASTLGSFSTIALNSSIGNYTYTHVEYGNGKWHASAMGSSTSGVNWISEDSTASTWIDIDDYNATGLGLSQYGNRNSYINGTLVDTGGMNGIYNSCNTDKVFYDPMYKTFTHAEYYYTTNTYRLMSLWCIDADDYYKWGYSPNMNLLWNTNPGVAGLQWSDKYQVWLYGMTSQDSWGSTLALMYDPATGKARTMPVGSKTSWGTMSSSNNFQDQGVTWQFGDRDWSYNQNGDNLERLNYRDNTVYGMWGPITYYTNNSRDISHNYLHQPVRFPNGTWAIFQPEDSFQLRSYQFNLDGSPRSNWTFVSPDNNLAYGVKYRNIEFDTVNETFSVAYGLYRWEGISYTSNLNSVAFSSARTTYATGTENSIKDGNLLALIDVPLVSVSPNGGASAVSYPGLGINTYLTLTKDGVYYIAVNFNGAKIYKVTDFASSNYELVSNIPVQNAGNMTVLWTTSTNSAYNDPTNPTVVDNATGKFVQLFTAAAQPESNVRLYDMNVEAL